MLRYIKIVSIIVIYIVLFGCSNEDKNSVKEEFSQKLSIDKNQTIEETIFQKMGLEFKNERITIDLNKTNNFFSNMEKRVDEKAKDIEKKIQNIDINITRDTGVEISDDRVSIDLNSTKNLLNDISDLFGDIISDINRTIN